MTDMLRWQAGVIRAYEDRNPLKPQPPRHYKSGHVVTDR